MSNPCLRGGKFMLVIIMEAFCCWIHWCVHRKCPITLPEDFLIAPAILGSFVEELSIEVRILYRLRRKN
jgi:hypothetical protein